MFYDVTHYATRPSRPSRPRLRARAVRPNRLWLGLGQELGLVGMALVPTLATVAR